MILTEKKYIYLGSFWSPCPILSASTVGDSLASSWAKRVFANTMDYHYHKLPETERGRKTQTLKVSLMDGDE